MKRVLKLVFLFVLAARFMSAQPTKGKIESAAGKINKSTNIINRHLPYESTRTFGANGTANVMDAAIDQDGNIVLAGCFQGVVNFARAWTGTPPDNKTASGYQGPQSGNPDIFITKINADGSYGWTRRIGNAEDQLYVSMAIDGNGDIYVVGTFFDTINFSEDMPTSAPSLNKSAGREDIFLLKMDPQGNLLWVKRMGGNGTDIPCDICTDRNNNVYITGNYQSGVDFSTDWYPSWQPMIEGSGEAFVVKINSNGSFGWQKKFGGNGYASGAAIAVNSKGEIYVAGNFTDTLNLKAAWPYLIDIRGVSAGDEDIFVMKLQDNGNFLWLKCIGGEHRDMATAMAVSSSDEVYLTGVFNGSVTFSRNFANTTEDTKVSKGGQDIFLTKLNSDDAYLWTKRVGGYVDDWSSALFITGNDKVLMAGNFGSNIQFQLDWGNEAITTTHGSSDAFFIEINKDGSYGFNLQIGGIYGDGGIAFLSDSPNQYYLIGNFQGQVNFSEPFNSNLPDNINTGDIFITKVSY